MSIEAFIFDMDGVLVNTEVLKAKAFGFSLRRYGVENGYDWYLKNFGVCGLAKKAMEDHQIEYDLEGFRELRDNEYRRLLREKRAIEIPETMAFLKELKKRGYALGVASSENSDNLRFVLNSISILYYFDAIAAGDEVKARKPAPDVYLLAAKRLNVKPERCVVIEDSTAGIEAAKLAGMYCIAHQIAHNKNSDLSNADLVVNDISRINLAQLAAQITSVKVKVNGYT